jgi:hypothetical protein
VTSTGEVLAPCAADFIEVLLDQDLRFRHLFGLRLKFAASSTTGSIQNFASPSAC